MLLGVIFIPSILFAQPKNRITLQTGLFHCFFDGSPLMNINYQNKAKKPFNGLLINSLGILYNRKIKEKNFIGLEYNSFREEYDKHLNKYPSEEPIVDNRLFFTITLNYGRILPLGKQVNFIYGGGVNFRSGSEAIIISRGIIGVWNGMTIYELVEENLIRNDFGLNTFIGIDYTPLKWLTLSTKINFLGIVYVNDKDGMREMREVYHSPQFPSRYDLSFNFGIGFNFGK
jgi:hypothetical protein